MVMRYSRGIQSILLHLWYKKRDKKATARKGRRKFTLFFWIILLAENIGFSNFGCVYLDVKTGCLLFLERLLNKKAHLSLLRCIWLWFYFLLILLKNKKMRNPLKMRVNIFFQGLVVPLFSSDMAFISPFLTAAIEMAKFYIFTFFFLSQFLWTVVIGRCSEVPLTS